MTKITSLDELPVIIHVKDLQRYYLSASLVHTVWFVPDRFVPFVLADVI